MMERDMVPEDPQELALRLAGLLEEYPGEAQRALRIVAAAAVADRQRKRPLAVAVPDVVGEFPKSVLGALGQAGMVLGEGYVCVLAAEGGIGKSSLVGSVALELAMGGEGICGLFSGKSGRVVIATYEDAAVVAKWRLEALAEEIDRRDGGEYAKQALSSIYVIDMESWPLYGPVDGAAYASRPVRLEGWEALWSEVERVQPRLVVVDPVLKAYVGESTGVSPVREFLGEVRSRTAEACKNGAGVLVTAHSTKAARGSRGSRSADPYDPGHVAGSTAWTDEPRGVLSMTWGEDGARNLSIVKANLGPSHIMLRLKPVAQPDGMVVGFLGDGGWRRAEEAEGSGRANGVKNGNGNGVGHGAVQEDIFGRRG